MKTHASPVFLFDLSLLRACIVGIYLIPVVFPLFLNIAYD